MGGSSLDTPLNSSGLDLNNATDAATFLGEILDDTELQVIANGYARDFWYGVVVIIGLASILNVLHKIDFKVRLWAAAKGYSRTAVPTNVFSKWLACLTAIGREATYPQCTPTSSSWIKVPPVGVITLLVLYLAFVIALEFIDNNLAGAQHFTSLGIRAAWLTIAQVPLLILLAGKNNLIGFFAGTSYERLQVFHRWGARIMLVLATLHLIFIHLSWNAYDLGPLEYSTDSCIPTGWATYAVLLWLNISTVGPIRNLFYEFFVVQHVLSWFGFVIAVIWHLPSTAYYTRVYVFIAIGLYIVDRLIRTARYAYHNARPATATLSQMSGGVTKICVKSQQIKGWTPGAHVLLSIPKLGPGQSHPATIASIPSSHGGDLVFLLKSRQGFTRRIHQSAVDSSTSLLRPEKAANAVADQETHLALIDGPYGSTGADFAGFDSVLLIAGSTGCTFTLPILLDLASRATSPGKLPVERIQFLWVVKNATCASWISSELEEAFHKLTTAGLEVEIRIHVTCDDGFTGVVSGDQKLEECHCECDKSLGPCCCVSPAEGNESPGLEEYEKRGGDVAHTSPSALSGKQIRSSILKGATFESGRPDIYRIVSSVLELADGETGVAVCGPLGLNSTVRTTVARLSDERAVYKGSGAQGVFLHAECFGW